MLISSQSHTSNPASPLKRRQKLIGSVALLSLMGMSAASFAEDMQVPSARILNTQRIIPLDATTNSQSSYQQTGDANSNFGSPAAVFGQMQNDPLFNAPDIRGIQLNGVSMPQVSISDVSFVQTTVIPTTKSSNAQNIDVSLLDDFIIEINPNARHYPPNFANSSDRYYAKEKLKVLEEWIRPYAENPNASYDVLIRAAKLNGMGRNLDLGSDYAVRANAYIARAIALQPDSAEANFLYGMMLSEGGGFKESKKYLNKAVSLGYPEAEQSLAQADLLNDDRAAALSRLQRLQAQNPNDPTLSRQIQIIQNGGYYIWDLPVN